MTNGDIARFETAWDEAEAERNNTGWRKLCQLWQKVRQQLSELARPTRRVREAEQLIIISESKVMTEDGHVLYIDPRCDHCRELFGK